MPIINVPQGYSARYLKKLIPANGINGLYTGDFSTCKLVLVVGTGKENDGKTVLMHIDNLTSYIGVHLYESDIKWLGLPFEVVIFSRKGEGDSILQNVKNFFSQIVSKHQITIKEVDDKYNGICVSFFEEKDNKPYKIDLLERKPHNLLCHPLEQRAYTVKKLYGILGLRAILKEDLSQKNKAPWEFNIFDGTGWTSLNENNLEINISQKITKEEMNAFNSNQSFAEIIIELEKLVEKIKKEKLPVSNETIYQSIIEVAGYLQFYLNDYNYSKLYHQNLRLMKENTRIAKVYQDMDFYEAQKKSRSEEKEKLLKLKAKGTEHLNNGDYEAAGSLYQEVYTKLPLYSFKSEPELANVLFNLGLVSCKQAKSLTVLTEQQLYYGVGVRMFSQCLKHRIEYKADEKLIAKTRDALEKAKAALQECEELKIDLQKTSYLPGIKK